jgi:hypothetical protein
MSHLRINEGFGPRFLPFSFFKVNVVSFAHGRTQNALKKGGEADWLIAGSHVDRLSIAVKG